MSYYFCYLRALVLCAPPNLGQLLNGVGFCPNCYFTWSSVGCNCCGLSIQDLFC